MVGITLTSFFTLPGDGFGVALALFAGFFLYIGASDLIPESYHAHPKFLTTVTTLAGAAVLYLAITFIGVNQSGSGGGHAGRLVAALPPEAIMMLTIAAH